MNTKDLTFLILYASLYVVITFFIIPLAFGALQIRISGILLGLIPIFGYPVILGQCLGVFISNLLFSSLGVIDILNVIPTLLGTFIIWKLKNKSVILGLMMYALITSLSVSIMLSYTYQLDLAITMATVFVGQFIACVIGGYLFYRICRVKKKIVKLSNTIMG